MTTQPGSDAQPGDPAYPRPYSYSSGAFAPPPNQPPPNQAPRRRRPVRIAAGIASIAAVTVVGVAVASGGAQSTNGRAIASSERGSATAPGTIPDPGRGPVPGGGSGNTTPGNGTPGNTTPGNRTPGNRTPGNTTPRNGAPRNGTGSVGAASASQQVGVVNINTVLRYQQAAAAGTGLVLSADGEILTNNHVIKGATSIRVTVVATGKHYTATVVGTAPAKDIAVLQLQGASGLKTADLGDSTTVSVGDAVTAVGNAGGKGGTPSAAPGKVTQLGRTISASDENRTDSETLHGVIVTDANVQSGDSGGPLFNAADEVIGVDTAASTSGSSIGFAIPINSALSVAAQIEKGIETSAIHIGYPGFLGVTLTPQSERALIAGVLSGGAAASAGLTAGDVITKVGSARINTAKQLQKAISSYDPGSTVNVTYTDPSTGSHTVTVTLATGPAD